MIIFRKSGGDLDRYVVTQTDTAAFVDDMPHLGPAFVATSGTWKAEMGDKMLTYNALPIPAFPMGTDPYCVNGLVKSLRS